VFERVFCSPRPAHFARPFATLTHYPSSLTSSATLPKPHKFPSPIALLTFKHFAVSFILRLYTTLSALTTMYKAPESLFFWSTFTVHAVKSYYIFHTLIWKNVLFVPSHFHPSFMLLCCYMLFCMGVKRSFSP